MLFDIITPNVVVVSLSFASSLRRQEVKAACADPNSVGARSGHASPHLYSPTAIPDAVKQAVSLAEKPVVISDMSDNPGGGSANDSVEILKELIRQNVENAAVATIYDPEVVKTAYDAGIGANIEITLGAKTDDLHGTPIKSNALVENLVDGRFQYKGPMTRGAWGNLGLSAVFNIDGIHVIVASERIQARDPEIL